MLQCTNFPAVIWLQLCLILIPEEQIGILPTVTEQRAQGAQSAVLLAAVSVWCVDRRSDIIKMTK